MIALMLTVLMFQLGSFRQLALVISVAPLGLIGVVAALLTTGTPMGFIAILGVVALAGMIIRNSVILVDQIEHERARGVDPWDAVIDATKHRFRPIMLTAAAAILGMIPIMHDVFWGRWPTPSSADLAVATALTLVFLPALYVAVNGIREKGEPAVAPDGGRVQPRGALRRVAVSTVKRWSSTRILYGTRLSLRLRRLCRIGRGRSRLASHRLGSPRSMRLALSEPQRPSWRGRNSMRRAFKKRIEAVCGRPRA